MAKTQLSIKRGASHNPQSDKLKSDLQETERLHVHISKDLKKRLKMKAIEEDKSLTEIIIELLEKNV